jgi:uncharacterized protein with PIN domain
MRWHEEFSRFNLEIHYIPGPENILGDAMSRWAYPAGKGYTTNIHGHEEDRKFVEAEEKENILPAKQLELKKESGRLNIFNVALNSHNYNKKFKSQTNVVDEEKIPEGKFSHCPECFCRHCKYRSSVKVQNWNKYPTEPCKCQKCATNIFRKRKNISTDTSLPPEEIVKWEQAYLTCPDFQKLFEMAQSKRKEYPGLVEIPKVWRKVADYKVRGGQLWFQPQNVICLPKSLRFETVEKIHKFGGHHGPLVTNELVSRRFFPQPKFFCKRFL